MEIVYELTAEARKRAFLVTGREVPARQCIAIDGESLSAEARALLLAANPELIARPELRVPTFSANMFPNGLSSKLYESERYLVPPTPAEIAALLAEHAVARDAANLWIDAALDERLVVLINILRERLERPYDPAHDTTPQLFSALASRPLADEARRLIAAVIDRDIGERLGVLRMRAERVLAATSAQSLRASDYQLSREQLAHTDGPSTEAVCAQARAHIAALESAEALAAEQAKAARKADKAAWIAAHGSDHLKAAFGAGYDCQRKYVSERAALEHPGYAVDFSDNAAWRDRSCPGAAALAEALSAGGEVVWLTTDENNEPVERRGGESDGAEAVVIRQYLGKYDLIKQF
jgi:hypothetical protein